MANDTRTVRYTAAELAEMRARGEDQTNWERVDALTEEELEASIDFEEEGEIDWDNVTVRFGPSRAAPVIHVDSDVLAYFRKQGPGYQTRMNQVLRSYIEAQEAKPSETDETRRAS